MLRWTKAIIHRLRDRLLTECRYSDWIDKQDPSMVNCDRWVLPVLSKAAQQVLLSHITVSSTGDIGFVLVRRRSGKEQKRALPKFVRNLDIEIERVEVSHGSTTLVKTGGGTFHSRNTVMAGNTTRIAAKKVKEKAKNWQRYDEL